MSFGYFNTLDTVFFAASSVDHQVPPRLQCAFRHYGTMHSSRLVDAVDHCAPPQMGKLALFHSTSPHFLYQFHKEVSHDFSRRLVFRVPPPNFLLGQPTRHPLLLIWPSLVHVYILKLIQIQSIS